MSRALAERPLVFLVCVALLALLVLPPAAPQMWAELVPALILLVSPAVSLHKRARKRRARWQSLSLLSLDPCRAPPAA